MQNQLRQTGEIEFEKFEQDKEIDMRHKILP